METGESGAPLLTEVRRTRAARISWRTITEKEALCYEIKRIAEMYVRFALPLPDRAELLRRARNLANDAGFALKIGRDISEDEILRHFFSENVQGKGEQSA